MDENRVEGTARNLGGKDQEGFGKVTGDARAQAEGVVNQAVGATKTSLDRRQTLCVRLQVASRKRCATRSKPNRIPAPSSHSEWDGCSVACIGHCEQIPLKG